MPAQVLARAYLQRLGQRLAFTSFSDTFRFACILSFVGLRCVQGHFRFVEVDDKSSREEPPRMGNCSYFWAMGVSVTNPARPFVQAMFQDPFKLEEHFCKAPSAPALNPKSH